VKHGKDSKNHHRDEKPTKGNNLHGNKKSP